MSLDDELRKIQNESNGLFEIEDSPEPDHKFNHLSPITMITSLGPTFGIEIGDYCPLTGLLCRCIEDCVYCNDCPEEEREKMREELRKELGNDLEFF